MIGGRDAAAPVSVSVRIDRRLQLSWPETGFRRLLLKLVRANRLLILQPRGEHQGNIGV